MGRKCVSPLLLILLMCGSFANTVCATAYTIKTYPVSEEDKSVILSKANIQPIETEGTKYRIECFDISKDGKIAVGIGEDSNCMINVYDSSGVFQYGYRLCVDGDFGIVYQDDLLGIYFLRGDTILLCNDSGICVDVQTLSSAEQGYIQAKEILNRVSKDMDGKKYVLERDFNIGDSYSRLVEIDEQGNRTILYNATTEHMIGQVLGFSAIFCFFFVVVWGYARKNKVT